MLEGTAGDEEASVELQDDAENQKEIDKIIPDKPVTDEEIAELLSGEAEVLKEHGVLGWASNELMNYSIIIRALIFQCQFQSNDAKVGRVQAERSLPSAQRRAIEGERARRQSKMDDFLAKAKSTSTDAQELFGDSKHLQAGNC